MNFPSLWDFDMIRIEMELVNNLDFGSYNVLSLLVLLDIIVL